MTTLAKENEQVFFFIKILSTRTNERFVRDTISSLPLLWQKWYAELIDLLKSMLDFSMFLELHFLLMSLATILLFTWFIVPYFYLAEHLTRNGYAESDAAELLSIIGITNTIGMVISSFTLRVSCFNVLFLNGGNVPSYPVTIVFLGCSRLGWRSTLDEC